MLRINGGGERVDRIVVFDVETPNFKNGRICSIGVTIVENGDIARSMYSLVNPECAFDYRNIQIHGITPSDVGDAPIFPEIWGTIGPLFRKNLVAAHNARFDLCVLQKTLQAYGINESLVYYVDTLTMSRALIRDIENHRLSTLCEWFGIPLDHHHAGSDSWATAKLLCRLLKAGADLNRYIRSYRLDKRVPPAPARMPVRLSADNQALLVLSGILSGMTSDNVLTKAEVEYLQKWMDDNAALKGNYPYDKIYSILSGALADGVLSQSELDAMLRLFKQVTDPVGESACHCGALDIRGKNVCLTGEFDCGSKSSVAEKLISLGARICASVSKKTDILLVGGQGSSAWCAGNYGTKVKKALELQEKGFGILIMRESDFFAALEGQE